jgi:hypothetical protein
MTLNNLYWKSTVIPSILTVGGWITYAIIYVVFDLGKDYKSEWMTKNDFLLPTVMFVLFNCFIVSFLSTGIFFNFYKQVKDNLLFSFLSWFLLPGSWMGYLLLKDSSFYVWSNTLPFLIALLLSFIKYRVDVSADASKFSKS